MCYTKNAHLFSVITCCPNPAHEGMHIKNCNSYYQRFTVWFPRRQSRFLCENVPMGKKKANKHGAFLISRNILNWVSLSSVEPANMKPSFLWHTWVNFSEHNEYLGRQQQVFIQIIHKDYFLIHVSVATTKQTVNSSLQFSSLRPES